MSVSAEAPISATPGAVLRRHGADIALLAVSVAAAAALVGAHWRISGLEAALAARPPVAIADYSRIVEALALGATPDAMRPSFDSVKQKAAALAAEGYLVVNRASVEAAPANATFGPDADALRALDAGVAAAMSAYRAGARPAPPSAPQAAPSPVPSGAMTPAEAQAILRGVLDGAAQ